jgi:hypothetical protein
MLLKSSTLYFRVGRQFQTRISTIIWIAQLFSDSSHDNNWHINQKKLKLILQHIFDECDFKLPPPPSLPETILDLTQLSAVEKLKLKVSVISGSSYLSHSSKMCCNISFNFYFLIYYKIATPYYTNSLGYIRSQQLVNNIQSMVRKKEKKLYLVV